MLVGAAAVIAVIVLIFVRPPADSPLPVGTVAPDSAASQSSADPAASGQPAVCTAAEVAVTAITDAEAYAEGVEPQLSWSLENTGPVACTLNVGTAQQVFTITSGDEVIWRSSDCQTDAADYPLTLEPAASGAAPTVSATIAWNRERSDADACDAADGEQVTAAGASYHLEVTVGGISSSDSRQFLLN